MSNSFKFNPQPDKEAISYFENKGLKPSFHWQDVWTEEHAHAFTVAKAMELDVLNTIRGDIQQALDNGIPFEKWKSDLEPKLIEMGWWGKKRVTDPKTGYPQIAQLGSPRRLKTIYDANIRTARAAGQFQRAMRTKAVLPYFLYGIGPSDVHRPLHVEKEGVILPVDDPFWNEWMPPNGWGCKCHVRQITKSEADKNGGVSSPPVVERYEHVNKRTGETTKIPVGIDPGWNSNPGKARHTTLTNHLTGKLEDAPKIERDVAIKDVLSSFVFQKMKKGELQGLAPVAVVGKKLHEKHIQSQNKVVLMNAATAKKLEDLKHIDHEEDYLKIQQMIDTGEVISDGPNNMVFQKEIDGRWWRAAVKISKDKKELLLSSLYKIKIKQRKAKRSEGDILREAE